MVGLEIINLLAEEQGPHLLAKEFDHVEGVHEAWSIAGEPGLKMNQPSA